MLKRMVLTRSGRRAVVGVAADAQGGRGAAPAGPQKLTAIRAGRLVDPETGTAAANQIILVEGERIKEIGANVAIPAGAEVIDLSRLTLVPGFVDTHTHLAMTYKEIPENNIYYYTYIADSTPLRAIQAASSAMQLLSSGFTVACDIGNNGNYADTALRQAIEQGWIPGPTIIPSGLIISTTGGQFSPTPEMYKGHNIVYPEYLEANSRDEIVKAVRENLLFGAKVIKICLDCKPWGYSVEDIKLFMSEAAKGGAKVQRARADARRRAARDRRRAPRDRRTASRSRPEQHAQMAQKTIYLASTDTPFTPYHGSAQGQKRAADQLKSAWEKGVPVTFSTDMDYWSEKFKNDKGEWMNRGELTINFLLTWKAAGIPAKDTLKALTTNGYKAADVVQGSARSDQGRLLCRHRRHRRGSADGHRRRAQRAVRDEERRGVQAQRRHHRRQAAPSGSGERVQEAMTVRSYAVQHEDTEDEDNPFRINRASRVRRGQTITAHFRQPCLDLRQRGEDDVADHLQAAGADGVERVLRRVPGLVVEIDDVDRRHAGGEERQVVVLDLRRLGDEVVVEVLALRRLPDEVGQPRRRVGVAADVEVAVADHVDQHAAP